MSFSVHFEDRAFQRALKEFIKYNQRDVGELIEAQARKVILGRGGKSGNVDGLRQLAWKGRATKGDIRNDMKPLTASFVQFSPKGPKKFVRFPDAKVRGIKKKELGRRRKASGWSAKILMFKWRLSKKGRSMTLKSPRSKQVRVRIRTKGSSPFVLFEASYAGLVHLDKTHNIRAKALRNGGKDMQEYIQRKVVQQFNMRG
jgi:hypothetical protein